MKIYLNSAYYVYISCGSFIFSFIYVFIHLENVVVCSTFLCTANAPHGACIFWNNVANHKVVAAVAVCWVHFSFPTNAARGGPIWDGLSFKINILYDLKSPSFVFFLAILV